jgi:hypothetical protein
VKKGGGREGERGRNARKYLFSAIGFSGATFFFFLPLPDMVETKVCGVWPVKIWGNDQEEWKGKEGEC